VCPVEVPLVLQGQVLLEVKQQVQGGHRTAAEEVPSHPVSLVLDLCAKQQPGVANVSSSGINAQADARRAHVSVCQGADIAAEGAVVPCTS
jgi:hypothetical protein